MASYYEFTKECIENKDLGRYVLIDYYEGDPMVIADSDDYSEVYRESLYYMDDCNGKCCTEILDRKETNFVL